MGFLMLKPEGNNDTSSDIETVPSTSPRGGCVDSIYICGILTLFIACLGSRDVIPHPLVSEGQQLLYLKFQNS